MAGLSYGQAGVGQVISENDMIWKTLATDGHRDRSQRVACQREWRSVVCH